MAKRRQRRGLLGVELHEEEIRVVETRYSSGKPIIMTAGSAQMPPKSLVEGEVVRADAVAFALRRLLDKLAVTATETVIGIPISGFATRSLKIPPTPPDEQAMLIEGEVRHFDILRTPDGAYDFFSLASNDPAETGIVLMAAEGHVTGSLRSVAERANLEVVALEPVSMGMLRAACSGVVTSEGLHLIIGETGCEASIVRDGRIWLYRRIDIGLKQLFSAMPDAMERIDHFAPREEDDKPVEAPPRVLRKGPADSLAVEVRRTMEFYAREVPDAPPLTVIRLLLNDPIAEPLVQTLHDAAGVEIQIVRPSGFVAQSDVVNQEMAGEESYKFCGAYGLALHSQDSPANFVPNLDLYVRERSIAAMESKRKTLTGSLAASIIAIALGIGCTYYFGLQANKQQHALDDLKAQVATLRHEQTLVSEGDRKILEQISFLSKLGVPAVWFMDELAGTLDPGLGLSSVRLDENGTVTIDGEASNDQALFNTIKKINDRPGLGTATVKQFERITPNSSDPSVRFSVLLVRGPGPIAGAAGGGQPQ